MKYAPHDPDYWEYVDIKQVQRREQEMDMLIDRSDNELDYNNADIPWQHLNKPRHDFDATRCGRLKVYSI